MSACMTIRTIVSLLAVVFTAAGVSAQTFTPGESYFGVHGYIEYLPGTLPLIISAPHGGYLAPEVIPDRTCGDAVYTNDAYTQELSRAMYQAVYDRFGCYPHLVINLLDRAKLDANRDLLEGACGNDSAKQAWNDFNDFLDSAEAQVLNNYDRGFYIDLHGHGHTIQRLELGYLLYADELQLSDAELNADPYLGYSSIQHLVETHPLGYTHAELLRGSSALGTLFDNAGYPSVPSQSDPCPASGDPYFSGGYNTAERSSYSGGSIDGVQIECNMHGVRNTADNRARFADSLASVLYSFLTRHIFPNGELADCSGLPGSAVMPVAQAPALSVSTAGNTWYIHAEADALAVRDLSGRMLFFSPSGTGTFQLDVSAWASGIYVITAMTVRTQVTLHMLR